jgi:hypothetical protein
VQRFITRTLAGGRLDDVVRGELTLPSALWLLAVLCREGMVRVDPTGDVRPAARESASPTPSDGGLVDPRLAADTIEWTVMDRVLSRRPYDASAEFFQSFQTPASLRRRLAVMEHYGDLAGQTILQLGDDEMFSVALALAEGVTHVHVADADPRVLTAIAAEAEALGLPLSTHEVDVLRERVPVAGIDTFFVSCLKDAGGLTACMAAAVATTAGPGTSGYVAFDLDVYKLGLTDRQVFQHLGRTLDGLECVVTTLLPCDDYLLDDARLADLGQLVVAAAASGATPEDVAERLRHLAGQTKWRPLTLRNGYPEVRFRSGMLARIETGAKSVQLAQRTLRFLQRGRAVVAERGA